MGLKPGYKQTEVGVIPEDWEVAEIGDLKPYVTSGSRGWANFYSEIGSAFIRITNMSRESIYLDLSELKQVKLPSDVNEGVRTQLQNDDVLISITADIGIISYVDDSVPKPAYINQHIALVRFNPALSGQFIAYFLASDKSQNLFRGLTDVGAKTGMSLGTIRKILLVLPPPQEQRAIAAALSDVDALITSLDTLIAKKRDIKQAAMQQLLTGKTRLPGFSAEWEVKTLGEIATIFKGSSLSKDKITSSGLAKCILYGELFTTYGRVITEVVSSTNSIEGKLSKYGDILIPGSTTTVGADLATASALLQADVLLGGDINIVRAKQKSYDPVFLAHYLAEAKKQEIAERSQGITIIHLYGRDLLDLEITIPFVDEQRAIAAVLSDMDAEIAVLERKRDKIRAIKQGMMQELLTGKIRLA